MQNEVLDDMVKRTKEDAASALDVLKSQYGGDKSNLEAALNDYASYVMVSSSIFKLKKEGGNADAISALKKLEKSLEANIIKRGNEDGANYLYDFSMAHGSTSKGLDSKETKNVDNAVGAFIKARIVQDERQIRDMGLSEQDVLLSNMQKAGETVKDIGDEMAKVVIV